LQGGCLRHSDHAGVGPLELLGPRPAGAVALHLAQDAQAMRLIKQFEQRWPNWPARPVERDEPPACPSCGAVLPPEGEECPACAREQQAPTSTWVLLRLWRFARPYRKQLLPALR
jgi:ATP-binding cassette subfamily B protein